MIVHLFDRGPILTVPALVFRSIAAGQDDKTIYLLHAVSRHGAVILHGSFVALAVSRGHGFCSITERKYLHAEYQELSKRDTNLGSATTV